MNDTFVISFSNKNKPGDFKETAVPGIVQWANILSFIISTEIMKDELFRTKNLL